MATIRNYIDATLQAAGTRINPITLASNIKVDTANVATGLQNNINAQRNVIFRQTTAPYAAVDYDEWIDTSVTPNMFKTKIGGVWVDSATVNTGLYATLSGQVTSSNIITYMAANSVSDVRFSQNTGMDASTAYTYFNFDAGGNEVIIFIFGQMTSKYSSTSGYTRLGFVFALNGSTVQSKSDILQFPNQASSDAISVSFQHAFKVSPPSGSVEYRLTLNATKTGDGSGGQVGYPTIIAMLLRR